LPRLLQSLKFQIVLAIMVMTALFATATLYSMHVIDQQHSDDVLVGLSGRLMFNQQHLTVQAMRYHENAPRDYSSYSRDLKLYFEDLKKTRTELTRLIGAFEENRFDAELTGETMAMQPRLAPRSHAVAVELAEAWRSILVRIDERIGPDPGEPRLEWAAEMIAESNAVLQDITARLSDTLQAEAKQRAQRANLLSRVLLGIALIVSLSTAIWFYRRVLGPLSVAVNGFKQVANGDFEYRVKVVHNNEIGWLAESFNHLSDRLQALRKLLTGLEQGVDLDATLRTLSTTLPSLIPVDWIGVLVFNVDGQVHLEKAYSDGKPDPIGNLTFNPDKTLLEECIRNREPLHIPDVKGMAVLSESYVFLSHLADFGRRDAIFLPIGNGKVQGVAVFGSRYPNNFRTEHLALLRNLGVLLGVSLGRTIQLTESSRLASIGQFASGIVHEIRNPLATISLAMEHLKSLDVLPDSTRKRVDLADTEVVRLERLLEDILLYAKPLSLRRTPLDLCALISDIVTAEARVDPRIAFQSSACPPVPVDEDRMRQVLLNLLLNAQQASPEGSPIGVSCSAADDNRVEVEIRNAGEPIHPNVLDRIFEPFVTTKNHGTGLGLSIVNRIVEAHGGEITVHSDALSGTRVVMRLPLKPVGFDRQPQAPVADSG